MHFDGGSSRVNLQPVEEGFDLIVGIGSKLLLGTKSFEHRPHLAGHFLILGGQLCGERQFAIHVIHDK